MDQSDALGRGVCHDQSGLMVVLLNVNIGNALHLLGLLLAIHLHHVRWYVKRMLLELRVGVVEVELEIMELIR